MYIDDIKTQPEELQLIFSDETFIATLFYNGHYIFDLGSSKGAGATGTFLVKYNGKEYTPTPETVTIESDFPSVYNVDLYISTNGEEPEPPEEPPEEPANIQPKADAGGPYYEIVNNAVNFDGSASYDSDGTITNYVWNFGDEGTSKVIKPTHIYLSSGNYRVTLTVTDNKGKTDIDITFAYIAETANFPPTQPVLNGPSIGSVNTLYNYTLYSTDIENDTIQYVFDWGDETDITSSHFLENGTLFTANHSWAYPGIYTLTAYTIDENNIVSEPTEINVLIDSIYCENIGYMIDYTNDSIYDLFHSNITREETPVELVNELYLIDDDNDGYPDYQYNITTAETSEYIFQIPTAERTPTFFETIQPYVPHILIIVLAALIASIPVLIYKIRKTPKKKVKKVKEKKKAEKTVSKSEDKSIDDRIKDIEEQVDELPSKKKS